MTATEQRSKTRRMLPMSPDSWDRTPVAERVDVLDILATQTRATHGMDTEVLATQSFGALQADLQQAIQTFQPSMN